jgi:hypothetical protein
MNRLSETLEHFGERLREAISSAVGESVGGVVRETIQTMLSQEPSFNTAESSYGHSPYRPQSMWSGRDDPDDEPWFDDPDAYLPDEYEDVSSTARADSSSTPSRLPRAIAIGFHTTLCWLQRRVSRYPVLTAVSVGLLTALAVYAGGPLAAAAVSLAGSAFNLLSLSEIVQSGADTLSTFGSS